VTPVDRRRDLLALLAVDPVIESAPESVDLSGRRFVQLAALLEVDKGGAS